jgi:hypothetical protein
MFYSFKKYYCMSLTKWRRFSDFSVALLSVGHYYRFNTMKTEDLIRMLATRAGKTKAAPVSINYMNALGWGALVSFILMLFVSNIRPDLADVVFLPKFQFKLIILLSLAGSGLLALSRLSRPGCSLGYVPVALLTTLVFLWIFALQALLNASSAERGLLLLGVTWQTCSASIALLSIPIFFALIRSVKSFAPTQLLLCGAAAGFLAGTMAALVYSLHCPEIEVPFIAVWYILGIIIPTFIGALLGDYLLRW